ncbi:MAG: dUTP diphosphatase [Spiroplasma sp.]
MLDKKQLEAIINLQTELDLRIAKTRMISNSSNQDILTAKFLALLVEIAEFANEQRCFKYWSSRPASSKEILLEEYIDGFHFIISIANNLKLDIINLKIVEREYENLNLAFLDLFALTLRLLQEKNLVAINQWFNSYYSIAKLCKFTGDDIFNGYLEKNKINHLRQEQNY